MFFLYLWGLCAEFLFYVPIHQFICQILDLSAKPIPAPPKKLKSQANAGLRSLSMLFVIKFGVFILNLGSNKMTFFKETPKHVPNHCFMC